MSQARKHSLGDDERQTSHQVQLQYSTRNNPSCVACHRRKVRCDRKVPCTRCSRAGWTCVYPSPERDTPRKIPPLQDISERLARLETILLNFFDKPDPQECSSPPREKRQRVSVPNPAANLRQESSRPWEFLLEEGHRVQYASSSNLLEQVEDV